MKLQTLGLILSVGLIFLGCNDKECDPIAVPLATSPLIWEPDTLVLNNVYENLNKTQFKLKVDSLTVVDTCAQPNTQYILYYNETLTSEISYELIDYLRQKDPVVVKAEILDCRGNPIQSSEAMELTVEIRDRSYTNPGNPANQCGYSELMYSADAALAPVYTFTGSFDGLATINN